MLLAATLWGQLPLRHQPQCQLMLPRPLRTPLSSQLSVQQLGGRLQLLRYSGCRQLRQQLQLAPRSLSEQQQQQQQRQ